ncbi:MAG TPA: PAS domain S-box protein, partial [Anaerolineaceae bacterium]|nr:PAS domain S-box protein [Anaerolineaceae bacterium]
MKKNPELSRVHPIDLSNPIYEANPILNKVLGSVQTCIAILDPEFNFLFVNQAYAQADGKEPDEFIGRNHFDLYPNHENETIFRRVVETRQPYFVYARPFVYPFNQERGITYWDWSLQPVVDRDGTVTSVVLMLQDVTERERASQALIEQQQLLARVFALAPDASVLVDMNGNMLTGNHQVEYLLGYRLEELIGQPIEILLPERFRSHHQKHLQGFFSHPYTRPMGIGQELVARKKDGSEVPVEIMLSPLNTSQGMVVLTVIRDISRRKETEAELTEMRRLLLIGLENERLQLAQDLHDSSVQELYGMLYQFQMLRDDIRPENKGAYEDVVEGIKRVNNRLRATCSELYPSTLIPFGLKKSMQSYAYRFQEAFPEILL